jgi:hypothetical protein
MLWSKIIGAGGAGGGPPIEFIGGVSFSADRSSSFSSTSNLNILGTAEVGDLVIISISGRINGNDTWSWVGMNFTDIVRGAGSDPFYYVGYKIIELGDTNPYVTGADWIAFAVTATVFRQASVFDAATSIDTTFPINPPSLTSSSRLWMVIGGKYASVSLLSTPPSYTLGASKVQNGNSANDATSSQFYKIEDLDSDSPSFPTNESSGWAMTLSFS